MAASRENPRRAARRLVGILVADPSQAAQLAPADLDLLLRLARRVKLLARLAAHLQGAGLLDSLPAPAIDQLRSALVWAESRVRLVTWELDRIARALGDDAPGDVLAMKGCAYLLHGIPNADTRIITDVDLMVAERDLDRIERRLGQFGWHMTELSAYDDNYYRRWTHELPPMIHVEREVEIDLHHNIVARTSRLTPDAALLLRDARDIDGSRFRTLSPADMTLHAMTHLMFDSDMADALRDLVDIDELVRHFAAREDAFWDRLVRRAHELGLNRPLFYALRYGKRLLGTPVPDATLRAVERKGPPRPVTWLMDRLAPRALLPDHPDRPSRLTALARLLLYMRSHWIRMPPLMLARHLCYKFWVRHVRGRFRGEAGNLAAE